MALFEKVQAVLSGRQYARTTKHRFAFSRLLRCASCGLSLIGERQKGRVYYRCHSVQCRGVSARETDMDDALRVPFALLAFSPEEIRDLRDFGEVDQASRADLARARYAKAKLELARCDDRMNRLTDAYLDGAIDKEALETRKAALLMERRGHADMLENPEPVDETDWVLKNLELGDSAQQSLEKATREEKREMVVRVTSNLSVRGKSLDYTLRFPFDVIADWRLHRNCDLHRAEPRTSSGPCDTCSDVRALWEQLNPPEPRP